MESYRGYRLRPSQPSLCLRCMRSAALHLLTYPGAYMCVAYM